MSILIIALPRTGSSELGRRLSTYNKFKYEFEPFNPIAGLPPLTNFKNIVLKTIIFQLPYYIKEENLPVILRDDAMARYLGLRPGEVVRILRPSPTSGTYVSYRICV